MALKRAAQTNLDADTMDTVDTRRPRASLTCLYKLVTSVFPVTLEHGTLTHPSSGRPAPFRRISNSSTRSQARTRILTRSGVSLIHCTISSASLEILSTTCSTQIVKHDHWHMQSG